MGSTNQKDSRSLVIVADDFGRKRSVNRAVTQAFEAGTLATASIMPGGEAFAEAVTLARTRPGLSLGLHVTLCDGAPVLPPDMIPDLVTRGGIFKRNLLSLSLKALSQRILGQIEKEVKAQFDALEKARIRTTHVDGHHHLHIHPLIFRMICKEASYRGIGWIRLPLEPFLFVLNAVPRRLPEWAVVRMVALYNRSVAKAYGMQAPRRVFGLSGTGKVDGRYLKRALNSLGRGVNEIFFHPDKGSTRGRSELNAVASLRFRRHLVSLGVELTNYGQLSNERRIMSVDRGRK